MAIKQLTESAAEDASRIATEIDFSNEQQRLQFAETAAHLVKLRKSSAQVISKTEELASLYEDQVQALRAKQNETSSSVAESIRVGQSAEAAATLSFLQSQQNGVVLGRIEKISNQTLEGVAYLKFRDFQTMSPTQQIEVLKNKDHPIYKQLVGGLAGTAAEDKIREIRRPAEIQKLKQDIASTTQTALAAVNGIATIGSKLGWDFVEDEKFQDGLKVANALGGLAISFATGNPVTAINAVVGLFGGNEVGPSAGEQEILQKLAVIDQKLDKVLKNQEQIIKLIEQASFDILKAEATTWSKIDSLDKRFDEIDQLATQILFAIGEYSALSDRLEECRNFRFFGKENQTILTHQERISFFNSNRDRYAKCRAGLNRILPIRFDPKWDFHPHLTMAMDVARNNSNGIVESKLLNFNNKVFIPLLENLWDSQGLSNFESQAVKNARARMIVALTEPSTYLDGLREKPFKIDSKLSDGIKQGRVFAEGNFLLHDHFLNLINPDRLIDALELLIFMTPYIDTENTSSGNPSLLSRDDISQIKQQNLSNTSGPTELFYQYNSALHVLNVAIAQQTLLSGDLLTPKLADIIFSEERSKRKNKILMALESNETLANNVMLFAIDRAVRTANLLPERKISDRIVLPASVDVQSDFENWALNLEHYDRLFNSNASNESACSIDNQGWHCIFPNSWSITNGKIKIQLDVDENEPTDTKKDVTFDLIPPNDVQRRQMRLRNDLVRLLALREKLIYSANEMSIDNEVRAEGAFWSFAKSTFLN